MWKKLYFFYFFPFSYFFSFSMPFSHSRIKKNEEKNFFPYPVPKPMSIRCLAATAPHLVTLHIFFSFLFFPSLQLTIHFIFIFMACILFILFLIPPSNTVISMKTSATLAHNRKGAVEKNFALLILIVWTDI